MRTTIDIPDDLLRHAKSEAALQGRTLKDLVEEGLRLLLAAMPAAGEQTPPRRAKPSLHDAMQEMCGMFDGDAPQDLSTNKKYFDDFGR